MAPNVLLIAPAAHMVYQQAFAGALLDATPLQDHPLRLAHFLAQVCHETGGLRILVESLSYSARRLTEVWPSRFPTPAAAAPFARNPRALANRVYGGRMGNIHPDDGWRYRGRGLLQITGREHYARNGRELGIPLEAEPELAIAPEHALAIALETWRASGCNAPADADDIIGVTKRINGGLIGLDDRRAWLVKTKAALELL